MGIFSKENFQKNLKPPIILILLYFLWSNYMRNFFEYTVYGLLVISLLAILNDFRRINASSDKTQPPKDKFDIFLVEIGTYGKYYFVICAFLYWSFRDRI